LVVTEVEAGLTGYRYAEQVIDECADAWKKLIHGKAKRGDISL
jgi:hypothetical protein